MKSIVMKSVYAGLGLIGSGTETIQEFGRKLAKRAKISEKDGERIARKIRSRSERAAQTLNKLLDREVSAMVDSLHAASAKHHASSSRKSKSHRRPRRKSTAK